MTAYIPFGELVSFNTITFAPGHSNPLQKLTTEWVENVSVQTGSNYGFDGQGTSAAPWKDRKGTWLYVILASAGLSGQAAFASVESQYNTLMQALQGTYTLGGAQVSGQVGNLIVRTADSSATKTAWARIVSQDFQLSPAKNTYALWLPLTWNLFSDFT